jgi:hypothetical protein
MRSLLSTAFVMTMITLWASPSWGQCDCRELRVLTDGSGNNWDVSTNGTICNGSGDSYDSGMALEVDGDFFPFTGVTGSELAGRQLVYGPIVMGAVTVSRRVYVPSLQGWIRYLESFENSTAREVGITVRVETNVGSNSVTAVYATSSGDTSFTAADRWLTTDDSTDGGGDLSISHNFWGEGAAASPRSVAMTTSYFCFGVEGPSVEFDLTVPARSTVILMHFGAQNSNRAAARAMSILLDGAPYAATVGIEDLEGVIVNWGNIDGDGDGFISAEDCDDSDPDSYPGADEVCDGADNDCDDDIDEDFDVDMDGFATCADDCNDHDAGINPEADEICDGADNDCDGATDEGFDIDADGFTTCEGDCADGNAAINPDAREVCNGRDDNCDGEIDEGMSRTYYPDFDRDGFGDAARPTVDCERPAHFVDNDDDCEDTNAAINPDAVEVCDDRDNNCNGEIDEGLLHTFYLDEDRDGFGDGTAPISACERPAHYVDNSTDCNDADRTINPDADEACDGVDNDCDRVIDNGASHETFYADADGDGHADPDNSVEACVAPEGYLESGDDCDDSDAAIYPGAAEICDGIDNNCDDIIDEGLTSIFYADNDGDGFGDPDSTRDTCTLPEGYVENSDDCNDSDALIAPGVADDDCDGVDDNCDGDLDDGAPTETYYFDADGDGRGNRYVTEESCSMPPGYVRDNTDCNDDDATIYPSAEELCDALDNDCNGTTDDGLPIETFYADDDDDGFGDLFETADACIAPEGFVDNSLDCDDSLAINNPDAPEIPDGVDNNCNGMIDEDVETQDEGCGCTAAGSRYGSLRVSGLLRLLLEWLGL